MSKIYFTSDTHFSHKRIREYCPESRNGFSSLDEMNDAIIVAINKKVGPEDTLYHLGDVGFCSNTKNAEFLDRLDCKNIHVCFGNHDSGIKSSSTFKSKLISHTTDCMVINVMGLTIVCSHYPIIDPTNRIPDYVQTKIDKLLTTKFDLWLHGHLHGSRRPEGKMFDVGVDTRNDLSPWSLDEIVKLMLK